MYGYFYIRKGCHYNRPDHGIITGATSLADAENILKESADSADLFWWAIYDGTAIVREP